MFTYQSFPKYILIYTFLCGIFYPLLAQESLTTIIKKVTPSVITILAYDEDGELVSQGSGFFVCQEGHIITNRHVLGSAKHAEIITMEDEAFPITHIVSEDIESDLIRASVDIPIELVNPLVISNTYPDVGEQIIVIGSPLGLDKTVSTGIISAVRDISLYGKIIQFAASLSSGSSGSPVVNMKGNVIGVASFQIKEGQNLNFAIPGEKVTQLKLGEKITFSEWKASRFMEELTTIMSANIRIKDLIVAGLNLLMIEDYEKALPYFLDVVEEISSGMIAKADITRAYYYIGVCYSQLGQHIESINAFSKAIEIYPGYDKAYHFRGFAKHKLGDYFGALADYNKAIELDPENASFFYERGLVKHDLDDYRGAIADYTKAIEINNGNEYAYDNRAIAKAKLGDFKGAILDFNKAIELNPDYASVFFRRGYTKYELGDYRGANADYNRAIEINPEYAEAYFSRGLIMYLRSDKNGACLDWSKAGELGLIFVYDFIRKYCK